ncbi:MAG TPA: sulfatase-like hydrolase/transferase [Phycisphaerae bacterium]|nr:sulfatase-like hydrolase/transferase [Phycisphaerae bacterium]
MSAAKKEPPNIVFFFTDDQRFDTISALGNKDIITPTLDGLVREATTFTRAYIMGGTSGAVCMPSRAMLHSGRTLFHIDDVGQQIPPEHVTLCERFRQAGYTTFGTGKWHNGPASYARSFSGGAEIFFGGMNDHWNVPACDFDPTGRYGEARPLLARWGKQEVNYEQIYNHIRPGRHSSDLFGDASVRFLREYKGREPFFMYVSFMAPHDPRETHDQYHAMYPPEKMPLPENFKPAHPFDNGELKIRDELLAGFPRTGEEIRRHIADYYAMITHADAVAGRVIEVLKETGRYGDTIIVFSGDNGLAVGRHGLMGKQSMYDHSVHVPLVMSGPGIPRGQVRRAMCYLQDIYPTLCDLAGLSVPDSVEGKSLVPVLHEAKGKVRNNLLFAYRHLQRSVQDERWKLIEYVVDGRRTTQLFNLAEDPFELTSLADEPACRDHLGRLRHQIVSWRDDLGDSCRDFWNTFSGE